MALITCTECGKEFSDKAAACPNCGCPTEYVIKELDEKKNEIVKCPFCGSESIDEDGYCNECGVKIPNKETLNTPEEISSVCYVACPKCGEHNAIGTFVCGKCGYKYTMDEYQTHVIVQQKNVENKLKQSSSIQTISVEDTKGGLFTRIKCPRCYSLNFSPVSNQKKFSVKKSLIGNTVGYVLGGPVGAVVGAATGINGRMGKLNSYAIIDGRVWEQKI